MQNVSDVFTAHNALEAALQGLPVDVATQRLLLRLDVFDESLILTRFREGHAAQCYEVSPEDVAAAFSGVPVATGLLPPNCLFFSRTNGAERLGIYVPPQTRALMLRDAEGERTFTLPLPGLVFVGEQRRYAIFAVHERPTQPEARLFHAPFPNVHGNGNICGGEVDFPLCSAATIHAALEAFLGSAFNGDLKQGKSRAFPDDVRTMWAEVAAESYTAWPLEDLESTPRTLADVMGAAS